MPVRTGGALDSVRSLLVVILLVAGVTASLPAQRLEIEWPTPSTAWSERRSFEAFIQPTASGVAESGLYGDTRSGGAQFHEGIDIKPVTRNRSGEPTDPVVSVMPGVVRHISSNPGHSSYGRYVVIEHTTQSPAVVTLYAHLASIAAGLSEGAEVGRGQVIGVMGRSASGYAIPKARAHLHFEIALMLTRDFQSWYNWKKFGSRNQHGFWNGMNLAGIDPLDFYEKHRARRLDNFRDYFAQMTPAVRLRVSTKAIPDFISRYPALLTKPMPGAGALGGWEIVFNEMGIPFAWTPLISMELLGFRPGEIRIVDTDEAVLKRNRSKSLALTRRGKLTVGSDLETVLQLLFGLREEL